MACLFLMFVINPLELMPLWFSSYAFKQLLKHSRPRAPSLTSLGHSLASSKVVESTVMPLWFSSYPFKQLYQDKGLLSSPHVVVFSEDGRVLYRSLLQLGLCAAAVPRYDVQYRTVNIKIHSNCKHENTCTFKL